MITGTLTSTLDWLSLITEFANEDQQRRVLGTTLDVVKVARTYEKELLFLLSEVNSCSVQQESMERLCSRSLLT